MTTQICILILLSIIAILLILAVIFLRKSYFILWNIERNLPDFDYNQHSEIHLRKILKLLKGKKLKKIKFNK